MKDINSIVNDIKNSKSKQKAMKSLIRKRCKDDFFYFAYHFMDIKSNETGKPIILVNPHKEVCDSLTVLDKNVMILLPREFGKTFTVELFIVWYIIHNPNNNMILFSETTSKAEEIIEASKLIMRVVPNFTTLYGNNLFSRTRNTLNSICLSSRTTSEKEPNVLCFGIDNSIQGYRANILLFEDIIGDKYSKSEKIKHVIDNMFFNSSRPLQKKTGKRIYVGTRWHYEDIPGQILDDHIQLKKWKVISKSIEDEFGQSAFPEIVSNKKLKEIREDVKSYAFYASQYLNSPKNEGDSVFNIENYMDEYSYEDLPYLKNKVMAVDLAVSIKTGSDCRALAVLGIDKDGIIYVIDVYNSNKISYTNFYHKIKEYYNKHRPQKVLIEINNAEPIFYQYRLKSQEDGDRIPFKSIRHTENKNARIETLEYALSLGYLRLPYSYKNNKYFKRLIDVEMEYFVRTSRKNKDDTLDALETAYNSAKKVKKLLKSAVTVIDKSIYKDSYIW